MSLRARLFGAIGLTLCFLLGTVVYVALWQGREVERQRLIALDFASAHVASRAPENVAQTGIVDEDGALDQRFVALLVLRPNADGQPVLDRDHAYGPEALEPDRVARAKRLSARALDPVWRAKAALLPPTTGQPAYENDAVARVYLSPAGGTRGDDGIAIFYLELSADAGGPGSARALQLGRTMFVVIVAAALALLATTWFIVDRVVARPLDTVVAAARRVAEGNYSEPAPTTGGDDEIQQVVVAINSMMVELDQFQGQLKERIGEAVRHARRTQDSLVIAQRLAATGRLAAGIAHEVNNPLAGMLNAVASLRTKEMSPERREEYLELVHEGLQRIQRTVAKILQFTPHKVAPREVSLEDVVRPVLALARHRIERDQVETVVELAEDALVFGDLYELQQALLNVVLNALDAMEDLPERESRLHIRIEALPEEVHMLVRDNGPGMAQADLERAFDLFFTTKETGKGSGMGLATVHKIMSDHGGRVALRSRGDEGMDVELILPRITRG